MGTGFLSPIREQKSGPFSPVATNLLRKNLKRKLGSDTSFSGGEGKIIYNEGEFEGLGGSGLPQNLDESSNQGNINQYPILSDRHLAFLIGK